MGVVKNATKELITGASGSGKSFFMVKRLSPAQRLVILDCKGDMENERPFTNQINVHSEKEFLEAVKTNWKRGFKINFCMPRNRFGDVEEHKVEALGKKLCGLLLGMQRPYRDGYDSRQLVFAVDECAVAFPRKPKHGDAWVRSFFNIHARNHGINIVSITQSISDVSMFVRKNNLNNFYFKQTDYTQIETIGKTLSKAGRRMFKNLKKYEFIALQDGYVSRCKVIGNTIKTLETERNI